ncbi:MAG: hypothetical protein OXT07_08710 [bacterium]|nr:hypothetical protein [bacterium]MDE0217139.1 hypothetical protein [bacterium]
MTVTLADLWPIMATAVGAMMALVVAVMRFQHSSLSALSDRIDKSGRESRELIESSSRESRELIESSSRESRGLIEKAHTELSGGLADVRERLAYIEGYLKPPPSISPPPEDDDAEAA